MLASLILTGIGLVRPLGPDGTLIDPGSQQADFVGRQRWPVRWHHFVRIDPSDPLNQRALNTLARDDDHTVLASVQRSLAHRQVETTFFDARHMAFKAAATQQGLHVPHKINGLIESRWQRLCVLRP
jgi:hypothetical protein